ncbi:hypothetical protein M8C21_025321 [Ambrosia artemisiifolia]|uniref:Uncharacterized protein n=1 Tax=Ambrosia artemisiifolia TaxID=4212 RepID=A0AAD5BZT1_AMBAR|nr:hypothetical protein M8C21_025321 [Ambrosia artemisiifolia]
MGEKNHGFDGMVDAEVERRLNVTNLFKTAFFYVDVTFFCK